MKLKEACQSLLVYHQQSPLLLLYSCFWPLFGVVGVDSVSFDGDLSISLSLLSVMALHCSFGFTSVLLGKVPLCWALMVVASCPICTSRFFIVGPILLQRVLMLSNHESLFLNLALVSSTKEIMASLSDIFFSLR